ncbi:MAG: YihY/virulence factor BrkB family protein [Caulobacterales bacterium]|nr:YihY/virulence factor BrkB family protein [Caulobacterales bacterium]
MKARARQIGRYVASRPYHLLPWIALIAAIPLWPKKVEPPPAGLSEPKIAAPDDFEKTEPGRGRVAERPHHIPFLGWRDVLWRTWLEIGQDRCSAVAGGITFYGLLAIFPGIAAFVSLYGLFADVGVVQRQLAEMSGVFPASVVQLIGDQMLRLTSQEQTKLSFAFLISILISLWSARAGMNALFDGLNVAYDETEKRNFAVRTALTYTFTLAAVLFLASISLVLVGLPFVLEFFYIAPPDSWWVGLRWLAVLGMSTIAFAVLYRYGPSRQRARWRWVVTGAVFAALIWMLGSLGFSWYLNTIRHLDATYGPLGAVIAFMLWMWFSVMAILIGAELNAEIEHQTAIDSTTGPEMPMGQRGAAMADSVGLAFHPLQAIKTQAGNARRMAGGLWVRVRGGKVVKAIPADPATAQAMEVKK